MAALATDLSIEQGSTFVLEFQVFDEDLNAVNFLQASVNEFGTVVYSLTDYAARMKIRKSKYNDTVIYTSGTTANYVSQPGRTGGFVQDGIFFIGGNTGFIRVVITSDTTDGFKSGRYFYDMELVRTANGSEIVSKILAGKVDIEAESTR